MERHCGKAEKLPALLPKLHSVVRICPNRLYDLRYVVAYVKFVIKLRMGTSLLDLFNFQEQKSDYSRLLQTLPDFWRREFDRLP